MDSDKLPQEIVQRMMDKDAFSQWLGIKKIQIGKGSATITMTIRPEMLNGFSVAHGGITFSFADSAFAFASNSQGRHAVSIETSISHVLPVYVGDELTAVAQELNKSHRLAIYKVTVTNQSGATVALFKGTVYRKKEHW